MTDSSTASRNSRPVFFFDIDNCLYSRSKKVHDLMHILISKRSSLIEAPVKLTQEDDYFIRHLSLSAEDAEILHQRYYKDYGLAVSGLALHHKIDPLNFNREVDDALPLDNVITPNPQLRKLLEDIDQSKVKLWLFTNAYITHAQRVVRLLGVEDMFEGVTYCDYSKMPLVCKPHTEMYEKAETEAGAASAQECFFVDDSHLNCRHAHARGWTTTHVIEKEDPEPTMRAAKYQIRDLEELRKLFPRFFKASDNSNGSCKLQEPAGSSQL